jgi:hypothetical protein
VFLTETAAIPPPRCVRGCVLLRLCSNQVPLSTVLGTPRPCGFRIKLRCTSPLKQTVAATASVLPYCHA